MKRALLIAGLGAMLAARTPAADLPAFTSGPIVNLPPMLVETAGKGPKWRHATIPGFEILSCAGDDATSEFTLKLFRLHAQLRAVVPATLLVREDEPMTLIFYPKSRAESLSTEMRSELDRVQTRGTNLGRVHAPPNLDLRDPDSSILFSIVEDGPSGTGWRYMNNLFGFSDHGGLLLSPEHVASLIEDRAPSPPSWFVIGVSRLYSLVTQNDSGLHFGPDPWLGADEARELSHHADGFRPMLPLAELLIGRSPPIGVDEPSRQRRGLWYAEAELFVRWCLEGRMVPTGSTRDALWQFADAASRQPVTEALFRKYFGIGFSDARDELSDYLSDAVDRPVTLELNHLPADPVVDLVDASPEVVHRIKGDWARRTLRIVRQDHPELLPIYVRQAKELLQKAYDDKERDPRLIANLGLLYVDIGQPSDAQRYLEESFGAGATRPAAVAELARLRLNSALAHPVGPHGQLSPEQIEAIMAPIRVVRKLSPPQIQTYTVAADLIRRGPQPASAEIRGLVVEGAEFFPSASALVLLAAVSEGVSGDPRHALQLTELGMWQASDAVIYRRLETVRNALLGKPTKG